METPAESVDYPYGQLIFPATTALRLLARISDVGTIKIV